MALKGFKIEMLKAPNKKNCPSHKLLVNRYQILITETQEMLQKRAVEIVNPKNQYQDQFISTPLVHPQKDRQYCCIFNLKQLNDLVTYKNFKMECLQVVKNWVKLI